MMLGPSRPVVRVSAVGLRLTVPLYLLSLVVASTPAGAQCAPTSGAGNDVSVCNSGSSGPLTDLGGNNTLTFEAGGTGEINGDVTFGVGDDRIEMHSGIINGAVDQGDGSDVFIMSAGLIDSLTQGGALDTFVMSGGRIIGLFFAGDDVTITGGRIGDVNLEQANNVLRMSGGRIDQNVRAVQGNDRVELSGGTIGGFIDLGNGSNTVTIRGGAIGGSVLTGTGSDTFTWDTAGTIGGSVVLGAGSDIATLRGLTQSDLASVPVIDGGSDPDRLIFDGTAATSVSRFANWEAVSLRNGAAFTLDGALILGDAGTQTGSLDIDASSRLLAGRPGAAISPFTAGQLATLTNAGAVDLTNGGAGPSSVFTVNGNYAGAGGRLILESRLDADGAPSDRLVVSGGTASGRTGIVVTNVGGRGDLTAADGILVVQATNGGTTQGGAFLLAERAAAGAYEYQLFRGGVSAGSAQNWYLRSTLIDPDNPASAAVPLYRPEVPINTALPPMAHEAALATLGTFHERRGSQGLLDGRVGLSPAWGRVFGETGNIGWSGTIAPSFDGHLVGVQAGLDILGYGLDNGGNGRAGLFVSQARMSGSIRGFTLGEAGNFAGDAAIDATSLGVYWTHMAPSDAYLDAVAMVTWFGSDTDASGLEGAEPDGTGITLSLEAGYPIAVGGGWRLEPQAQIVWQSLNLDSTRDTFSAISYDTDDSVSGRLGLRLEGSGFPVATAYIAPYFKANIWHDFDADDAVAFDGDAFTTARGGSALELGGGLTARMTDSIDLHASAAYVTDVGGDVEREGAEGTIGLQVKW